MAYLYLENLVLQKLLFKNTKEHNYDPIFYEPHEQRNKNNLNLDNTSTHV